MGILEKNIYLEVVAFSNPKKNNKIEGSIELSCNGGKKKVTFEYFFNNRGHDIMTEGHEVDITIEDKNQNKKHNIQYTYPDKNLAKIHFRIYELWRLVEKIIAELSKNPLLKKKDTGLAYGSIERTSKKTFQILFDPF